MGEYHAFIRVAGRSIDPGRQSRCPIALGDDLVMGGGGAVVGEYDGFEERIRSQAIGPVQAGAGDFSHGEKAGQGGLAAEVGGHAAAEVMGGGNDRCRLLGEVEAGLETGGVDMREALGEVAFGYLGGVE